ncbi:lipid A deacylase LpxR family protein [Reichenbachiella agarivorans]|uniref:Lipid A deacylase LpxR family protein n=1 Tax=Reichenbachiella agarivorans TaxID=2979464 RepID=A0ABY6CP70_9BACT|nr:lipid A deacylase LpxR family protein [Reichenbachiella agarivorans]UXP32334.1 lipid A deacylase LpxR family protein [Reichenbachiella agarivorans]
MKYYFLFFILIVFNEVFGQSDSLQRHEVAFQFDNDLLFFDAGDRYYTNGLFIDYRRLPRSTSHWSNLLDLKDHHLSLIDFSLVSKIYNPYNLKGDTVLQIDRPYAGVSYLTGGYTSFWKNNSLTLGLDLGWLGSGTHLDRIQTYLHNLFGWVRPRGWDDYQINNTPYAHLYSSIAKELVASEHFSVIGGMDLRLGTVQNYSSLGLTIRLGRCLPIYQSTITNSRLGTRPTGSKHYKEIFFVSKTNLKSVFHNVTIEGNWLGTPSPFVKESVPWVIMQGVGVMMSTDRMDFQALWSYMSREVQGGRFHKYGSLVISRRF